MPRRPHGSSVGRSRGPVGPARPGRIRLRGQFRRSKGTRVPCKGC
ncbi:hypothetical protein HMPREF0724_10286 [Prescottella equi ATCC 33707]|uniref:Uncharacterized protein n=1 Tax=Prescottella equi ATCC 33707 TaxID=525370 RepID=E9SVY6_RHOHA|nr:hypothetical protein HMPREF0724_10286 [Prescottella equi ATCC 33707]